MRHETLKFRGLKFRQPVDSFGVEVFYQGRWYGTEALYLRDIPRDYTEFPNIELWLNRISYGSAKFTT